jgi:ferrous iron transport protein B
MHKTVVLVGNPNVGKSVIFNRLTGRYAVVSNYPGTTVDVSRGSLMAGAQQYQIVDTPGTASLVPVSEDEQVTRDVLFTEKPSVIVQVGDAKNLARTLMLTMELLELATPLILVLNMGDEALDRGIRIDRLRLEKLLGIAVVETIAVEGEGIRELKRQLPLARQGIPQLRFRNEMEALITAVTGLFPAEIAAPRALALLLLSDDASALRQVPAERRAGVTAAVTQRRAAAGFTTAPIIFNRRNSRVNEMVQEVQSTAAAAAVSWLERLGDLAMRPFPGYPLVLLVLAAMYLIVGVFGAGIAVDFLQNTIFARYVNPFCSALVTAVVPVPLLQDLLIGPYGLITMAFTYALAIVFPIVTAFFFFFGLLEDSGYLPRLSIMLDRFFRAFGLNGKAVLPLVLGLGCGTMAALSTRILETRKERVLVLLLLSLTIPCSAQLGIILGMLAGLSWKVTALWLASIIGSLYAVGALANRVVPGQKSPFVLEIPPLRRPSLGNIALKVRMRLSWYLVEAVPLFALGTVILFVMDRLRLIVVAERLAAPVVTGLLSLPQQVTQTFIMGFLRRDYGAAGLFVLAKDGLLTSAQALVSIIAVTLFVPCIAQCFMVVREQGIRIAAIIFVSVTVYAVAFAALVNLFVRWSGVL